MDCLVQPGMVHEIVSYGLEPLALVGSFGVELVWTAGSRLGARIAS